MSNALPNQKLTVKQKFREQGFVDRNWAIRNFITRLSAIIFDMKHIDGWDIETVITTHPKNTIYRLIKRPGDSYHYQWSDTGVPTRVSHG